MHSLGLLGEGVPKRFSFLKIGNIKRKAPRRDSEEYQESREEKEKEKIEGEETKEANEKKVSSSQDRV